MSDRVKKMVDKIIKVSFNGFDPSQPRAKDGEWTKTGSSSSKTEEPKGFEKSKVRDDKGNLIEVYHGTDKDFKQFDDKKINSVEESGDYIGEGIFFTKEKDKALRYAEQANKFNGTTNKRVISAYLDIKNPLIINSDSDGIKLRDSFGGDEVYFELKPSQIKKELIKRGYDGLIDKTYNQYAVFSSSQIKILN